MNIRIGNAPCSWGVEFPSDPRNPTWQKVLEECAGAGYKGIELGPVGFMPEDPEILGEALNKFDLELIGGVVFRAYHDDSQWEDVLDGTHRTCKALAAHGAQHLVLIDSISERRAPTAGRANEAVQMDKGEWTSYRKRLETSARIGAEEYGLIVGALIWSVGGTIFLIFLGLYIGNYIDKSLFSQIHQWAWTSLIMLFYIVLSVLIVSKYLQKFSKYD